MSEEKQAVLGLIIFIVFVSILFTFRFGLDRNNFNKVKEKYPSAVCLLSTHYPNYLHTKFIAVTNTGSLIVLDDKMWR